MYTFRKWTEWYVNYIAIKLLYRKTKIIKVFCIQFCEFSILPFYWFLTILCGLRRYVVWYLSFKTYWDLICGLTYGLPWKMFQLYLRRICVLLLGRVLCICLLDLDGLLCWVSCFLAFFSVWLFYPLIESRVWKSSVIVADLLVSLFNCFRFCFMYFNGVSLWA